MAAMMAKELRQELEQMMQLQMNNMLSVLEQRLAKAVVDGSILACQSGPDRDISRPIPGNKDARNCSRSSDATTYSSQFGPSDKYQKMCVSNDVSEAVSAIPRSARDVYKAVPNEIITADQQLTEEDEEVIKAQRYHLNSITLWMLVINAFGDAFEADYQARHHQDRSPAWYQWFQLVLCFGFLAEFVKRASHEGFHAFFFKGNRLSWHYFQLILVASQVVDTIMVVQEWCFGWPFPIAAQIKPTCRVIGAIRVLRIFHVLDHLDYADELHLLLASMRGSLRSLAWSALFMLVPTFVLGISLTHSVTKFRVETQLDDSKLVNLVHYYGTLDRSLLSLFICISGGLSWSEALYPLQDFGFVWEAFLFLVYVSVMIFAVLNILTGVFVNSAESAASSEKQKSMVTKLKQIFKDADDDGSCMLSQEEFRTLLTHKDIGVVLQSLNISPAQAQGLFHLIDQDGSGSVASEEFLNGCNKFAGTLSAIDFAFYALEFRTMRTEMQDLSRQVGAVQDRSNRSMTDGARPGWIDWMTPCKAPSRM